MGAMTKKNEPKLSTAQIISRKKRKLFLQHLARTGKVGDSARAAGYADSNLLNKFRKEDEDFAREWEEAINTAVEDVLEPEAWRRAVEGVPKPIFFQGKQVGVEQQYSDGLLQFLLKGAKPEKYKNNVNVSGNVNLDTGIAVVPMVNANVDDWESKSIEDQRKYVDVTPEQVEDDDEV